MNTISLHKLIENNFEYLKKIENKTIICELGVFNYLLLKNNTLNNLLEKKVFVIFNEKLYENNKFFYKQGHFPLAKLVSLKAHAKIFNINSKLDNKPILLYVDYKEALCEHNNTRSIYISG